MNREEIIVKLTPIAQEIFQKPEMMLSDNLSAQNVDTWTSLAFMQFLTAIEEQFEFKFKMLELLKLKTMGDILSSVEQHLA